jgi:hypothetical protein
MSSRTIEVARARAAGEGGGVVGGVGHCC